MQQLEEKIDQFVQEFKEAMRNEINALHEQIKSQKEQIESLQKVQSSEILKLNVGGQCVMTSRATLC
jgi:predicted  nucleic acid-binding Zn-ribbon protein